jgi:uncharacterized small protein (DUF1192 family)
MASKRATSDPPFSDILAKNAAMVETIARLEAENKRLKAARGPLAPELLMLKSIPCGTFSYETLRTWWHRGLIVAERDGSHLLSTVASVAERIAFLTRSK